MMAGMLTQLPLPLLPAGAAEIAPGVGLVTGGGGLVSVHGLATFAWDAGDEAGRRLAAVQLVRLRAVSQARTFEPSPLNSIGPSRQKRRSISWNFSARSSNKGRRTRTRALPPCRKS